MEVSSLQNLYMHTPREQLIAELESLHAVVAAFTLDGENTRISARRIAVDHGLELVAAQNGWDEAERIGRVKDDFLANLFHELRTPITAILGWSRMLNPGIFDPGELSRGLDAIRRNAHMQARLIDDLLDMSRIISGKLRLDLQRVELPTIIDAALESVNSAANAKMIVIQKFLDPLAEPVIGDPSRLQQVVWNLLLNAVKFTPQGGKVQVTLERVNSHMELSVSDDGQGIAADFLPHVFDRLSQAESSAKKMQSGLGRGLSIVKSLSELHGGSVRVKSDGEDKGATFTITLPISPVHASPHNRTRHRPMSASKSSAL
jgi:signal transduction histidine kinase